MSIQRRPWLALLCLSGLTASAAAVRADEPTDDLLAIWRKYATPAAPSFSEFPYPVWPPNASESTMPPIALATTSRTSDFSPIVSSQPFTIPMLSGNVWEPLDRQPRKMSQKMEGVLGSLDTQIQVTDLPVGTVWDDPSWKRTWQTSDSWQMGVLGPLSVFGQFGANSDEASQSNMKVNGRTGVAWKLPAGFLGDYTFRSGPGVSYTDPLHPLRTQGRSDWLLEVQAHWPLLFGIGLEYQGSALPSMSPLQQDLINQDLRLAFPFGANGKLKVGAKHQWSGMLGQPTPGTDNMQLYLGLELKR